MATTTANSWDAAKIIRNLSAAEVERLAQKLQAEKSISQLFGRKYNVQLCKFVERRLQEVSNG